MSTKSTQKPFFREYEPAVAEKTGAMDVLTEKLLNLRGGIPEPRMELSEEEKDRLVALVGGPKTAASVVQAGRDFAPRRVPFLFSSLDTQAVVDMLHNDMTGAIHRAREQRSGT